jgi:acetyltransferase-like isoleucine patch superfamily enzyme
MKADNRMGQIPLEDEFHGIRAFRSIYHRILLLIARAFPMYPSWRVGIHRQRGVIIGGNAFIGSEVFIDNTYQESIIIEDFVTILSRTFIIGHSFIPSHLEKVLQKDPPAKKGVILKKGCYIGAQCIIMPGVTIGECSIIGAGSVVAENIPPYSVAMGAPAKVVRTFTADDVKFI